MHVYVCVVTACAHVLWPRPEIYCNYYVRAKFKPGGAPGCYDARGNTALESLYVICHVTVCPSKLVKGSVYGFRTSLRNFDSLGCDLENVECLKRDVYYCNIYMYT